MPGDDFHEQSDVFNRVSQRADLVETAGEGHQPKAAHSAVGRLQPGDAAESGRAADGPARIGADGKRGHARGDAGGRATAGAAGNSREVPRIVRGVEGRVLVRAAHGELVHVRLADEHGVGRLQTGDHGGIVGRAEVLQHPRSAGRRLALRAENVFHSHGQSAQAADGPAGGAAAIDLFRSREGRLRIDAEKGPYAAVVPLDLLKIRSCRDRRT